MVGIAKLILAIKIIPLPVIFHRRAEIDLSPVVSQSLADGRGEAIFLPLDRITIFTIFQALYALHRGQVIHVTTAGKAIRRQRNVTVGFVYQLAVAHLITLPGKSLLFR